MSYVLVCCPGNLDRCRADPNVMSETGFTSLILAAAGGHLEVVKTLVEKVRL